MTDMPHYVYVFRCGDFHKVGMTSNVKKRLGNIIGSSPYDVELVHFSKTDNRYFAYRAEQLAHNELKQDGKHHRFEWFKECSDDELAKLVVKCCSIVLNDNERLKYKIRKRMRGSKIWPWQGFLLMTKKERRINFEKTVRDTRIDEVIRTLGVREVAKISGLRQGKVSKIRDRCYMSVSAGEIKKAAEPFADLIDSGFLEGKS